MMRPRELLLKGLLLTLSCVCVYLLVTQAMGSGKNVQARSASVIVTGVSRKHVIGNVTKSSGPIIPKHDTSNPPRYMKVTLQEGSFLPSFSLHIDRFISVANISPVNKLHYIPFYIEPPQFPRQLDEELFAKFEPGREWLDPFENAVQTTSGLVEVISNGTFSGQRCYFNNKYESLRKTTPNSGHHFHKLCPLFPEDGFSFQHFFDRALTKIMQVRELLLDPDMKILLEKPRASDEKVILSLLDKVGIQRSQIVWYGGGKYTADYLLATCISPHKHPSIWRTMRGLLRVPDKITVPPTEGSIVLLTRPGNSKGRSILNKNDVIKFIQDRYGEKRVVIFSGGYSLDEAIELFGKTRLVIGIHGGAFYNLNFASKDTILLEITPYSEQGYYGSMGHMIFWTMSQMIGQEYWRIFARDDKHHNVQVDLNVLNNTLSKVEAKYKIL